MSQQQSSFMLMSQKHCGNSYLSSGCQLEGHNGQEIMHIFINEKPNKESYHNNRFGCAECVSRRPQDRTLSLVTAVNIPPHTTLHNFPALDNKISDNVQQAIKISNSLDYDATINEKLDQLKYNLRNILSQQREESISLANKIMIKGQEMEEQYRKITDCSSIKNCVLDVTDYTELNNKFNKIIKDLYDNQAVNDQQIKSKTEAYLQKLATFGNKFAEKVKKVLLETIDKISFEKLGNGVVKQLQINPRDYLKQRSRDYEESSLEFTQEEPENEKMKKYYLPLKIETQDYQIFGVLNTKKSFYNQAVSLPLNPLLTYKITFELQQLDKEYKFIIGLGDYSKKNTNLYESNQFFKFFNFKADYKKGCNFVEYGNDLTLIQEPQNHRIVMKFNISRNLLKFQDELKKSCNTLDTNAQFDKSTNYCIYLINQTVNFEMKVLKVQVKKNN